MNEILTAGIGAVGTLFCVLVKVAWDSRKRKDSYREKRDQAISAAEIADRADYRDQLIVAYNQIIAAAQKAAQEKIELERARYVAEEKLSRREEEHRRELGEARRLTEHQHGEITLLEAQIKQRDIEINDLKTRLDGGIPDPHRDPGTGAIIE